MNAGVITVTLSLFTAAAIVEERRQILRTETASAEDNMTGDGPTDNP